MGRLGFSLLTGLAPSKRPLGAGSNAGPPFFYFVVLLRSASCLLFWRGSHLTSILRRASGLASLYFVLYYEKHSREAMFYALRQSGKIPRNWAALWGVAFFLKTKTKSCKPVTLFHIPLWSLKRNCGNIHTFSRDAHHIFIYFFELFARGVKVVYHCTKRIPQLSVILFVTFHMLP